MSTSTSPKTSDSPEVEISEKSPKDLEAQAIQENAPETSDKDQNLTPDTSKDESDPDRAEEQDFLVWWDGDQDPANPQNWPNSVKWSNIAVLSSITFLTLVHAHTSIHDKNFESNTNQRNCNRPLASAMFAPGVPQVMREFNTTSSILATFVVSVFVLGFAFGPLLLAPLSEMYGRLPVYHTCNILFLIFTILCAVSQNIGMLVAFRFLSGFAGVATVTCGSGTIADLMPPVQRGKAMALWSLGPILGPIVGPVIGGFLIEAEGWRWAFWLVAIAVSISMLCFHLKVLC